MSLHALETTYHPAPPAGAIQTLSHQFEDIEQQNECYIVGMWTFLVTEIMFFGALFCAYSIYRTLYFTTYLDAHRFLSIPLGTLNTFVLLTSSLFMALGVHAAQMGRRKAVVAWLVGVVLCSVAFLGIKSIEYSSKFHEKLFPGPSFNFAYAKEEWLKEHPNGDAHEGASVVEEFVHAYNEQPHYEPKPTIGFNNTVSDVNGTGLAQAMTSPAELQARTEGSRAQLFFSLYFAMTGLHAIHIIIGILLMTIIGYLSWKDHPSVRDYMTTEMVGFYWHFVDIVWIFLFPLMYLIS